MTKLYLTSRALSDFDKIERDSVKRFGQRTADEYIADLNDAIGLLEKSFSLFQGRHD